MTEINAQACAAGAAQLVGVGLGVHKGQEVLIVCDETTVPVATMLADAAATLGAVPGVFLVPLRQQRADAAAAARLGSALRAAIQSCSAMLNVLDGGQGTLAFRRTLLEAAEGHARAIAHLPGATLEVLAAAGTDDPEIDRRNEALARGLAVGRRLQVLTRGPDDREHCLDLDLGGWARTPILSGRTIVRGTWGNLPGGETYIKPVTGDGELLVDGSIDSLLLAEPLIVSFRDGRLHDFAPRDSQGGRFLAALAARSTTADGPDWNWLAELGIGTNASLRDLVPTAMLNEKVLGTCHVAFGDRHKRDGERDAHTQIQLVSRAPSIIIDGTAWIDRGHHLYDLNDPGDDYDAVVVDGDPGTWRAERTGHPAEFGKGRLWREWYNTANRRHRFSVGNHRTARLAAQVYRALPPRGERPVSDLARQTGMDALTLAKVLAVTQRYELVVVYR